jgi:hypothetical protein
VAPAPLNKTSQNDKETNTMSNTAAKTSITREVAKQIRLVYEGYPESKSESFGVWLKRQGATKSERQQVIKLCKP